MAARPTPRRPREGILIAGIGNIFLGDGFGVEVVHKLARRGPVPFDGHTLHPLNVLRLARAMGATLENSMLVGCEPLSVGPEEGQMGLSEPVSLAVDRAGEVIEELVENG